MNKKANTAIFLLAATVLNLLILAVLATVLLVGFSLMFKNIENVSMALSWLAIIIILFGSIAGTFFLYSKIVKWAVKKWNLENYIDPIFKSRKR